jgi:cytoskeletal protein CcmA (bactofilin family)
MWKRDEAVRPPQPAASNPVPTPKESLRPDAPRQEKGTVNIGKSVVIKGDLTGSEDLTIEGQVEGKIELRQNVLTIGANGRIKAQIFAKVVIVQGDVQGNITASERIDIRDNGSVDGDLVSPRIAIADGAHFRGSIDMQRQGKPAEARPDAKPEAKPAPVAAAPAAVK